MFKKFFDSLEKPSMEDIAKVAEEVVEKRKQEETKEIHTIEANGKFEVAVVDKYNDKRFSYGHGRHHFIQYCVEFKYDVLIELNGQWEAIHFKDSIFIDFVAKSFNFEMNVLKYIASYLEGTMEEKEIKSINNKIKDSIVSKLNSHLYNNNLEKARKLIEGKTFNLNLSMKAEKNDNNLYTNVELVK